MSAIPRWLAAAPGHGALPGQVNQLLGAHNSTWLYAGTQQAAQTTGSGVYQSAQSQYLAQGFTTGSAQTQIGVVQLQISAVGGSPTSASIPPLVVSLYASDSGSPTGSVLASTSTAEQLVYAAGFWLQVPLPATVIPATVYQLVVSPAGSTGHYYVWQQSNQASGASTSPDGVTWTAQSFGLLFQVFDQGTSGMPQYLVDDSGAKVTQLSYTSGALSQITESILAQDGSVLVMSRSLSYSNATLIGVA